ncbi:hypothetical protein ABIE65_001960 [Constrictibacter sp. MBR-5]|jgi:hypothetical protein
MITIKHFKPLPNTATSASILREILIKGQLHGHFC